MVAVEVYQTHPIVQGVSHPWRRLLRDFLDQILLVGKLVAVLVLLAAVAVLAAALVVVLVAVLLEDLFLVLAGKLAEPFVEVVVD